MKSLLKNILDGTYALELYRTIKKLQKTKRYYSGYKQDFSEFLKNANKTTLRFQKKSITPLPLLNDKTETTPFEPHYTYHPAWAARILAKTKPSKHIDISSTLHFCTIVSAFIPIDFYDYRPANLALSNLHSKEGNLLSLPFENSSVESLSCMHTIEHIGLGRYGDEIDYDGDLKAINELKRVLKKGGNLIIVTPIGRSRIEFNAHRVYSYSQIVSYFSPLTLREFSLVPDDFINTGLILNADEETADQQEWGCGCFWFQNI